MLVFLFGLRAGLSRGSGSSSHGQMLGEREEVRGATACSGWAGHGSLVEEKKKCVNWNV
jgi:hypothetical protein